MRLTALLLLACALPALAEPVVQVTERHYPVDLATSTDPRTAISAASPIREGGRIFHGYTRWFVNWRFDWRTAPGHCRISAVRTRVDVHYTLPEIRRPPRDAGERTRVSRYLSALTAHEQGHADIAIDAARRIEAAILATPPQPDCARLEQAANARGHAIIQDARATERAYDARTGHGRTQGAYLD